MLQQPHLAEMFHNRAEQPRGYLQVKQRPTILGNPLGKPAIKHVVGDVTRDIGQPTRQPVKDLLVDGLTSLADRLAGLLSQLVVGQLVRGNTQDRTVQKPATLQPVQRAKRHLPGEITGDTEDH
jgi:hypothetical protein